MTPVKHALCAATLLALPLAAQSATIRPYEMAFFSFDLSGLALTRITATAFSCIFETQCFNADGLLAPGRSLSVSYGFSAGGDEFGTRTFTNSFPTPINNAPGNVLNTPVVTIPATVAELFATFSYVDDTYTVTDFRIFTEAGPLTGTEIAAPPETAPVAPDPEVALMPLSASGWMLLLGLGALGVLGHAARRQARRRG